MSPTPEEWVADQVFHATGGKYRPDPQRLYDGAAAGAARRKAGDAASVDRIERLAFGLRHARKAEDLEVWDMRRHPTPERTAAARAAQATAREAQEQLWEACASDRELYADVCARYDLDATTRPPAVSRAVAAWVDAQPLPAPGAPRTPAPGPTIDDARRRLADIQRRRRLVASVRAQESRSGGTYR